jgi:hypothetical protein
MNSDSYWDNTMVQENKNLIMFLTSLLIIIGTIYWCLMGHTRAVDTNVRISDNTNIPQQIIQNNSSKRRITIHISDITDIEHPDIKILQVLFEKLTQIYDIFMIVLVDDNINTMGLLEKYEPLCDEGLIYKHVIVLFTVAYFIMVRSIDPYIHIDSNEHFNILARPAIVVSLVKFIHLFWLIEASKDELNSFLQKDNLMSFSNKIVLFEKLDNVI